MTGPPNTALVHEHRCSVLGQRLNIKYPTERRIQTGSERDYGKYTFNIASPGNITILKVIKRYPVDYGEKKINHNPQTILIYEDFDKKEIGMIDLVDFCTNHPRFGFDYNVDKDMASRIKQDATFQKGEVFPLRLEYEIPRRTICLVKDTGRPVSISANELIKLLKTS